MIKRNDNINLNAISKVNDFCNESMHLKGLLKITDGIFIVDGKSVLGLFSLNLTNPLSLIYEYDELDKEDYHKYELLANKYMNEVDIKVPKKKHNFKLW